MKNHLSLINKWRAADKEIAIARVVKTWNASPRPVGSVLLINEDQEMAGSVSGGCVEGAVLKAAMNLFENKTARLLDFGVSNDDAWSVGLSCGGRIQVYLELLPKTGLWSSLEEHLQNNQGCIWVSPLMNNDLSAGIIKSDVSATDLLSQKAQEAYRNRKSQIVEIKGQDYFLHVLPQKSQLFLIGAAHLSADLIQLAKSFSFETIVIDPRGIFANKTQFPSQPDHLFNDYPSEILPNYQLDAYTFAVTLSHDPKIDDNALEILLKSKVAYIGALGSRRTQARRVERLLEKGFSQEAVDRIHGPVGIDINARRPQEIALSIMAQIVEVQNEHL
ncbi:MAG TPA: XdhC family protein [Saprospiraceae bacterium]|nr:XdhC family protein [Saprospiraceae bacterium]